MQTIFQIRAADGTVTREEPKPGRWNAAMYNRRENDEEFAQAEDVGMYLGAGAFDDEGDNVTSGMIAADYLQMQV